MIYIFIICIILLLLFCLFTQKSNKSIVIKETFENKAEVFQEEAIREEISQEEAIQQEAKKEAKVNKEMGKEWEKEIKDSTFQTFMPSQITYENTLSFPDAEIKLEPRDKVYVNPFFPDDKSKGTIQLEHPRQNYPSLKENLLDCISEKSTSVVK
jgi:predicted Holliday junction resolvase-like endonuclease